MHFQKKIHSPSLPSLFCEILANNLGRNVKLTFNWALQVPIKPIVNNLSLLVKKNHFDISICRKLSDIDFDNILE